MSKIESGWKLKIYGKEEKQKKEKLRMRMRLL